MADPKNKLKKTQYHLYPPIEISADDFEEIIFSDVEGYIIGTSDNPVPATSISVNFDGAKPGTEVLIFHNAESKPTFDAGDAVVIFREIGSYVSSVVNPISILFIGGNKLMILYGNDAAGIQDGVDFTSAGVITFDSPTQIDYSGFFWRKAGVLNSSGTVNDVTVPGAPTTYNRVDILEGGSANDVYYKAGDEAEDQPFPAITAGRVLLASILRNTGGTNDVVIIDPDTSDFVSKSSLPNQTIQSDFTLAKHAGNLGKIFAPDANGKMTVIDFPDPRRGIFTSFSINILSPTSGEVTAKWIGYNGVTREVTDEPVTFIGLPSASNFREDLIQGLDDGTLFVKSGTENIEGATTVPSSDPDKVSLGVVTWSHTGEYEVSQPAPATIATNKRYATRIAPNTTGKYAKVCDFNLSNSQNFHAIISFGNPVNPVDIKGSAGLLMLAFTCDTDATIVSETVQIETIGNFTDLSEFVLVEVSATKAELYHKSNHYWSRIQYAFTFYNSPLSEPNFYNDQPYGSLPAGNNWGSVKGSSATSFTYTTLQGEVGWAKAATLTPVLGDQLQYSIIIDLSYISDTEEFFYGNAVVYIEYAVGGAVTYLVARVNGNVNPEDFMLVDLPSGEMELYFRHLSTLSEMKFKANVMKSEEYIELHDLFEIAASLPAGDEYGFDLIGVVIESVTGNMVNLTDPANPVISSSWGFQDPELPTPSDVTFVGLSASGQWFRTGNIVLYHYIMSWTSATVNVDGNVELTLPSDALPASETGFYSAGMSAVLAMGFDFDAGHTYTGMQVSTTLTMRLCSSGDGISTIDFMNWSQMTGGNGQLRGTIMLALTMD